MRHHRNLTALLIFAFSMAFLVTGCHSSQGQGAYNRNYDFSQLRRVAVVGVQGPVGGEAAKAQLTNFFNQQLLSKGYNPIERQQIKHLLAEQDFQGTNLTGTTGAAQIGRVINVKAVILLNVPRFDEEINMSAKMIDVQTGSVLWSASGSGKTGSGLTAITGALVGGAAGAGAGAATGSTGITIAGGAAGGAGGAVVGEALTPQKEDQARKVIEKLCVSLPSSGQGGYGVGPDDNTPPPPDER